MTDPFEIGWKPKKFNFSIRAGSAGTYQGVVETTRWDDTPLPNYNGWTAKLSLYVPFGLTAIITKQPVVTGDADAHTLTFDLDFEAADTASISPCLLQGSLWMTSPDGKPYCAGYIFLTVEPHDYPNP